MNKEEMESLPQLITRIVQLEQQQVQLKRYIAGLKRRLDEQPKPQQLSEIQDNISTLQKRLDELSKKPDSEFSSPETEIPISADLVSETPLLETEVFLSTPESQLVFDRSGSRSILIEALDTAVERLIIVCPWLNCNSIDDDLLQKFRDCLNRSCQIEIGWGYLGDRNKIGKGWRYNALGDLQQLEQEYKNLFHLKLLGTHEKYLVCDHQFAMLGSHNVLTSGVQSAEREVGIRTTDPQIIQGLIQRFDETKETEKTKIIQQVTESIETLDEAEYLEGIVETEDIEDEEDEDDIEESSDPPVTAEEFLQRHNEGEQDFTGINLTGVDLSKTGLGRDVNFSSANLYQVNFNYIGLFNTNFTGTNLKEASLKEIRTVTYNSKYQFAIFEQANLENATLYKAQLQQGKFQGANLNSHLAPRKANMRFNS